MWGRASNSEPAQLPWPTASFLVCPAPLADCLIPGLPSSPGRLPHSWSAPARDPDPNHLPRFTLALRPMLSTRLLDALQLLCSLAACAVGPRVPRGWSARLKHLHPCTFIPKCMQLCVDMHEAVHGHA
eukprot:355501-Chlamydomonas_euryale.AAC.1